MFIIGLLFVILCNVYHRWTVGLLCVVLCNVYYKSTVCNSV